MRSANAFNLSLIFVAELKYTSTNQKGVERKEWVGQTLRHVHNMYCRGGICKGWEDQLACKSQQVWQSGYYSILAAREESSTVTHSGSITPALV